MTAVMVTVAKDGNDVNGEGRDVAVDDDGARVSGVGVPTIVALIGLALCLFADESPSREH